MTIEKRFEVHSASSKFYIHLIKERYSGKYRFYVPATQTYYTGEFETIELALDYFAEFCDYREWTYEEV
jgi:hypothetical protein